MTEDLTGFYSGDDRQFFVVGTSGEVLELLAPDEVDGLAVVAAKLPLSATPLDEQFVLPSFVLRVALHLGLQVTPPLDQGEVMAVLDELFWRRDGEGWADATAACECHGPGVCEHIAFIEQAGFVLTDDRQRVRLTPACIDHLTHLSVIARGRRFPAREE